MQSVEQIKHSSSVADWAEQRLARAHNFLQQPDMSAAQVAASAGPRTLLSRQARLCTEQRPERTGSGPGCRERGGGILWITPRTLGGRAQPMAFSARKEKAP